MSRRNPLLTALGVLVIAAVGLYALLARKPGASAAPTGELSDVESNPTEQMILVAPPSESGRAAVSASYSVGALTDRLVFRFTNSEDEGVSGVSVQVCVRGNSVVEISGLTGKDGICLIDLEMSISEVLSFHASAKGFATVHFVRPVPVETQQDQAVYAATLRRSGTLNVNVTDEQQMPLPWHWVTALYFGPHPELQSGAKDYFPGAQLFQTVITDERGFVTLSDLDAGYWDVYCEEWKDREASADQIVEIMVGEDRDVTLRPGPIEPEAYASGVVVLDLADGSLSEFMTIDRYGLMTTYGEVQSYWLYRGGVFFVFGQKDERMSLRVVDQLTGLESLPFEVRIGHHDHRIHPEW